MGNRSMGRKPCRLWKKIVAGLSFDVYGLQLEVAELQLIVPRYMLPVFCFPVYCILHLVSFLTSYLYFLLRI